MYTFSYASGNVNIKFVTVVTSREGFTGIWGFGQKGF